MILFCSVPFTVPFPFYTRKRPINMLGMSYRHVKNPFARCLESIVLHCHGLLNFTGTLCCCHSSTLSVFCDRRLTGSRFRYRQSVKLVLESTQIGSKCSRSTEIVPLSAFLDSSGVLFELATVRPVFCTFCRRDPSPVPFLFIVARNGCLFPFS